MINTAYEWVEIFLFALVIGTICAGLVLMALLMALGHLLRALFTLDYRWILE